jgi:hypothetical protein
MRNLLLVALYVLSACAGIAQASLNPPAGDADPSRAGRFLGAPASRPTSCTNECKESGVFAGNGTTTGGAASFELFLTIPKGGAGALGGLALDYSSRVGNGALGMGWSINAGIDAVFRCPQFVELDGYRSMEHFSESDRLCWDGERLLLVSGQYDRDGSTYMTEMDSGLVFTLEGDVNSANSRLVARDKEGNTSHYDMQSVPNGAKGALYWYVTSRELSGVTSIRYLYQPTEAGEGVIREIDYAGPATGSKDAAPTRFVRFEYSPRDDASSTYVAGGESRQSLLLRHITAGTLDGDRSNDSVYDYSFAYQRSQGTGRTLIHQVQGCVRTGDAMSCLHPANVDWIDQPIVYQPPRALTTEPSSLSIAPRWELGEPKPSLAELQVEGDFGADGRADIVARNPDNKASVLFLDTNANVVNRGTVPDSMTIRSARWSDANGFDLRHVGAADLVGDVHGKVGVSSWRQGRFSEPQVLPIDYTGDVVVVDADGDGQPDLVQGMRANGEYVITVYRNTGSSDTKLEFAQGEVVARLPDKPGLHLEARDSLVSGFDTALLKSSERVEGVLKFVKTPKKPLIAEMLTSTDLGISEDAQKQGFLFADVNGDKLADIVYVSGGTWWIQLNVDGRFAAPVDTGVADVRSSPVARSGTIVTDIDSDGADELLFPARRLVDYCIRGTSSKPVCSDELGSIEPGMDLGIYDYDALKFRLDAHGAFHPEVLTGLHLVAQANRSAAGDVFGEGYSDVVSPFDRGVENGAFRTSGGALSDCPEGFGCGLRIASQTHKNRADGQDIALDAVKRVQRGDDLEHSWTYFPISNPVRHLYNVPPLESPQRFLGNDRHYFTSSMYVVGEDVDRQFDHRDVYHHRYGGAVFNTVGRGFAGFEWLATDDLNAHKTSVDWYRQEFPFFGVLERTWTQTVSDDVTGYLEGTPGKQFLSFDRLELRCHGPPANPLTNKYHCDGTRSPSFWIEAASAPSGLDQPDIARFDRIGEPDDAMFGNERKFRDLSPEPSNAQMLKTAWAKASAAFELFGRDGARADVDVVTPGRVHHGEDRYLLGSSPPRMDEKRDTYEVVTSGLRACARSAGWTGWSCFDTPGVIYGLPEIQWEALIGGSLETFQCDSGTCARIVVNYAGTKTPDKKHPADQVYSLSPDKSGHRLELIVSLPDYRPISLKQIDHWSRTNLATATYAYHFDGGMQPIVMP